MRNHERSAPDTPRDARGSAAPAWWLLGAGLAASAVTLATPATLFGDIVYYAAATVALGGGWVAVARGRRVSRALVLLLAGATVWLLGDWIWWILELVGHPAGFPTWVDAVYFSGYGVVIGGLTVLWRHQLRSIVGGLLDSAALAGAIALLLWAGVIDPERHVRESASVLLTAIGYPALDIFVLIGLSQLLLVPALRRTRALQALSGGVLMYIFSDLFYAYSSVRSGYTAAWQDTGWLLLYVLWGFAVLHPSVHELELGGVYRLPTRPARIIVLALACLTAPLAMFVSIRRDTFEPGVYAVSMTVILLLVFWRMAVIFSDYRHAEADAEEGREFYRALVDNGPDLVMLMAFDGELLFASPSFERILGYTPAEVVGKSMLALTHPDDLAVAYANLSAALDGDAIPPFTIRARNADDAVVLLEVTATVIDTQGGRAILSQARDVTRSHLVESSLAETSSTLETLVAATPAGIVVLDTEARVTLWSPGAVRLFGWTAEEALGRRTPLRSAEDIEGGLYERYLAEPVLEEGTRPRKDGTNAEIVLSSAPLRASDGTVTGMIGVFLDVSERKHLEESLRQAQRLESVGQLAGGVAHDFNNLLTAICGYTSLALERADGDDALRADLDEITRASERATELTRKLLAFSRRQMLQLTTFDLNGIVADSTGLLSRLLGEHIRIDTSFLHGQCTVRADPGQIEQVLMNLAVNGRDAMDAGGTLTIETDHVELDAEDAHALEIEPGPHVLLRVRDTGAGMDAETAAHAFDPFFTTKPVGQGTGLGLATVYGIVRQSGGAITIESTPGSGTSVEVLLPEDESGSIADRRPAPAQSPRGRERILLVEDEAAVRRLTVQLLEAQGYEVVDASGPLRALELATDNSIDLLATDITMPEMDGTELAARLRDRHPDLPVLFLSGYPRGASLDAALGVKGTGFLQKPYGLKDLALAVRATIDDRAGA